VLENNVRYTSKRAPSLKNAITHDLSKQARENGEASNIRDIDLSGEDYEAYKAALSEDEKKRLINQLIDSRHVKEHGVRATNKAVAMDSMQTSNQVGRVLINLHSRTGTRAFAMFTRGDADDPTVPCFVDSDDARQFSQEVFECSLFDVVRKFELWSCNRDKELAADKHTVKGDSNDLDVVRRQITEMTEKGWEADYYFTVKITGNKTLKMTWANYQVDIVHEYGVELAGWPENVPITRPSKMAAEAARLILTKLKSARIHWVALTKSQRTEIAAEIEEQRESGTLKQRKPRSDKNCKRGPRAKKVAEKATDDDDDDSESDLEEEEMSRTRAHTSTTTTGPVIAAASTAPTPSTITPAAHSTVAPASSAPPAVPPASSAPPAVFVASSTAPFGDAGGFFPATRSFPSTAPGSQLVYDAGYEYDFSGLDMGLGMPSLPSYSSRPDAAASDLSNGWRLNILNHGDFDVTGLNGGNGPEATFNGTAYYAAGFNGGNEPSFATGFDGAAASAQFSGGMPVYQLGAADNVFPASLIAPTGPHVAPTVAGPSMSVFSVATNVAGTFSTGTKKRKKAEGGGVEKPARKPRARKSMDGAEGDEQPKRKKRKSGDAVPPSQA
ncbi:hypothetical protein DFH09DRAFT_1437991, partial [Mycena vulgaris]